MSSGLRLSRRTFILAGSALAASALLAACGEAEDDLAGSDGGQTGGDVTPTPALGSTPTPGDREIFASEGDAAVVSVEFEGGFVALEDLVRRTPIVSLFSDGRLIYPGPMPEIFPQPALQNMLVTTLSAEGMQAAGARVLASGLFEDGNRALETGEPVVADAPTTVITVRLAGQEPIRVSADALAFGSALPGDDAGESGEREAMAELFDYLTAAPTALPADQIAEAESSYRPERLEIITYPWDEIPYDFDELPEPTAWPLHEHPLTMGNAYPFPGHTARSAVLTGDDLDAMLEALASATVLERWEYQAEFAALINRPLLPGQKGGVSPFGDSGNADGAEYDYVAETDAAVLRYELTGGFVPLEWFATQMPLYLLFGDGRMISQGAQITIYPPPALPSLEVTGLTAAGIEALLAEADAAGLLQESQDWDDLTSYITDLQTGVLTITAGGETYTTTIYAPGLPELPAEISDEERAFRTGFDGFIARLADLQSWLPEEAFRDVEDVYPSDRLQIVSQPAALQPTGEVEMNEIDWPQDTPLAELGEPHSFIEMGRCFVLESEAFATLMSLLHEATTLTRWTSGGEEYILYLRPLLPDEEGCSDPLAR